MSILSKNRQHIGLRNQCHYPHPNPHYRRHLLETFVYHYSEEVLQRMPDQKQIENYVCPWDDMTSSCIVACV